MRDAIRGSAVLNIAMQYRLMWPEYLIAYLLLNVLAFGLYGLDKRAAIDGRWRVPERTLLAVALVGGSLGAVTAQRILRHKTRKEPFRTRLMLIVALHVAIVFVWLLAPGMIADFLAARPR